MSKYQALLDELTKEEGSLVKSQPAAAEDKAKGGGESDTGDDLLAKAITVVDENGEECMAFDAGALINAFGEKIDGVNEELGKALVETLQVVKAQGERLSAANSQIGDQAELIKSLSEKVEAMENAGAGRKSVLSIHERKSELTKGGQPEGIKPDDLLQKATGAAEAGRIGWGDLSRLEAQVLRGPDHVDADLVRRVMGE